MHDPRDRQDRSAMMVTVGIGICVVRFVFAVVAWWLGWRAAVAASLPAMAALATVCGSPGASGRGHRPSAGKGV